MAYTADTLITRAYYLSQIDSFDLQTVTGSQTTEGLFLLNEFLDLKSSDLRLIPYFQEIFIPTIAQQEKYFVPNCLFIDSLTYNIGPVRYAMMDMSRKDYFAGARVDQVYSLPMYYRPEREYGGMNVYLYFPPAAVYTLNLWGKFALTDVTLQTDLSLTYDGFYIAYLRYGLAIKICQQYGQSVPDATQLEFNRIEKKLLEVSPADLKVQKRTYFGNQFGFDWQMANLFEGYVPF